MTTTPQQQSEALRTERGGSLSWTVHPARERLGVAMGAVTVIVALAWLSAELMDALWWGLVVAGLMTLLLHRFLLPNSFRIDAEGITATRPWSEQRLRWSDIRRFVHDERGGLLSTRARPSLLDGFRGMHLLFGEDRERVIATIRERLDARSDEPCSG
ncbi:MAG: hypothetical protein ACREJB_10240 [Planctomycetaceae bacterium]